MPLKAYLFLVHSLSNTLQIMSRTRQNRMVSMLSLELSLTPANCCHGTHVTQAVLDKP
jgi:hypothetical protein